MKLRLGFLQKTLQFASLAIAAIGAWERGVLPLYAQQGVAAVQAEVRVLDNGQKALYSNYRVPSGEMKFLANLEEVPAGTKLYHWTKPETHERWVTQAHVDRGEIEFLKKGSGALGGGVYASADAWDSKSFGGKLVTFEVPRPVLVVKGEIAARISRFDAEWATVHEILSQAGVSGYEFSPGSYKTWFNFIEEGPVSKARAGSSADVFESSFLKTAKLGDVIELSERVPLSDHPQLRAKFPVISKILRAEKLNSSEWKAFWTPATEKRILRVPPDSPLRTNLAKVAHPEFVAEYRRRMESLSRQPYASGNSKAVNALVTEAMGVGVTPSELFDTVSRASFMGALGEARVERVANSAPEIDDFGKKLWRSFEFIGYDDLAVEFAEGRAEPWRRYHEEGKASLLERWEKATGREGLLSPRNRVTEIHKTFSGEAESAFRDHRVTGGGDIQVGGKGYYRITEAERRALEANPFLKVEFLDDISPTTGTKTFLARHEYPSAQTFRRFENYLSPGLRKQLAAAEAAGALDSPGLTRKVLEELFAKVTNMYTATPLFRYQMLMSVHPFGDYNGRSLRAFYQFETGKPLFLRDWNIDLFRTYPELAAEVAIGENQLGAIRKAMLEEYARNPKAPKYYDLPELWQVAVQQDAPPVNAREFVQKTRAWYADSDSKELVRHKETFSILKHLENQCIAHQLFQYLGGGGGIYP